MLAINLDRKDTKRPISRSALKRAEKEDVKLIIVELLLIDFLYFLSNDNLLRCLESVKYEALSINQYTIVMKSWSHERQFVLYMTRITYIFKLFSHYIKLFQVIIHLFILLTYFYISWKHSKGCFNWILRILFRFRLIDWEILIAPISIQLI